MQMQGKRHARVEDGKETAEPLFTPIEPGTFPQWLD
jgi:hypothetical protein